jgi:hypothetical protein
MGTPLPGGRKKTRHGRASGMMQGGTLRRLPDA